ncbi:MAG: hypothetical protein KDD33_10810 [Bdellovibrionales bacterium]|nr:hypothetical protein [Bdellovibrionales bacterium]
MDRYITQSKYFTPNFNTAIFSDPIRIYFSNQHESQALEIYFLMQKRKNEWEKFLRSRGKGNYCYLMLYPEQSQFAQCFENGDSNFSPGEMGEDFVIGINGPLDATRMQALMDDIDGQIGYQNPE